jgi:hypothetical protein
MRRTILLLATMALTLLVATGVALAVTKIGGPGPDTLRGTNGADNSEEQADKPRHLPEVERPLDPGEEYRTEEFKPSFSFRVGKGWSMETDPPEAPNTLEITWRKGTINLFFLNIQEVYEPTKTGGSRLVQAPKDMVGWFQHHPYLRTVKRESVTVGGEKGVQLDLVVEVPKDYHGKCGTGGCLDIAALGDFTAKTGLI